MRIVSMLNAVFGSTAYTVIPSPPVAGTAYRNADSTPEQLNPGMLYNTTADSATLNEMLYRVNALMNLLEKGGILEWSALTDYDSTSPAAYVKGSDGAIYYNILISGPNQTAGVKDPVSNPTYWTNFSAVPYILPAATDSVLGGVKIGNGLNIASGVVSAQGIGVPDWSTFTSLSSGVTYTASVDGWVLLAVNKSGDGLVDCFMTINGHSVPVAHPGSYYTNTQPLIYMPIKSGDTYLFTTPGGVVLNTYSFYPNR